MDVAPEPDERVVGFYAIEDEQSRLSVPRNRLEFVRTQELLRGRLPPSPAHILDVGGGTGAHAGWLAADGHEVHLVDVVPEHVAQAGHAASLTDAGFRATVGDARALPVADGSVDACLLLGPLYHLPDARERANALAEAARVTRQGGLVAAAAISRFAWPMYALRDGGDPGARSDALAATLRSGVGDPGGYLPSAFSHRPDELAAELAAAGLIDVEVLGVEGPGWLLFGPDISAEDALPLISAAASAARLYDGYPEMAASSAHLLGCARRP